MARKAERAKKPKAKGGREESLEALLADVTSAPAKEAWEQNTQVECPYCGEDFEVPVSSEEDGQVLIEDCHVCCRPVSIHVSKEDDELQVSSSRS